MYLLFYYSAKFILNICSFAKSSYECVCVCIYLYIYIYYYFFLIYIYDFWLM